MGPLHVPTVTAEGEGGGDGQVDVQLGIRGQEEVHVGLLEAHVPPAERPRVLDVLPGGGQGVGRVETAAVVFHPGLEAVVRVVVRRHPDRPAEPVEHLQGATDLTDETVTRVLVPVLQGVEVGVVPVVALPVVSGSGGRVPFREPLLVVRLEQVHVHLTTEPDTELALGVVSVVSLGGTIVALVGDVLHRGVHLQAIRSLDASGEVQARTLQLEAGHHPVLVEAGEAQPTVEPVGSPGDGNVRDQRVPHLVEVVDVVRVRDPGKGLEDGVPGTVGADDVTVELGDHEPLVQGRSPALVVLVVDPGSVAVEVLELPEQALTVLVLIVGQTELVFPGDRLADDDVGRVYRTDPLLGLDEDGAVGRRRAVESGSVRALQHGHRLDGLGVDVVDEGTVVVSALVGDDSLGRVRVVVDGNAVDDEEGLVVAQQGVLTAHHDPRRPTLGRRVDDLDSRHLSREAGDDVLVDIGELVVVDLLRGDAQGAGLPLQLKRRDDQSLQSHGGLAELDAQIQRLTGRDRDVAFHLSVSDEDGTQRVRARRHILKGEPSVLAGQHPDFGVRDEDLGSGEGAKGRGVHHRSPDRTRLLCEQSFRSHDQRE